MKTTRVISGFLALVMSGALISGCTKNEEKGAVTLKYVMAGAGLQQNSQTVWAEFNKKLQEKLPNVTVEFEIIPLSEYKQKIMLMQSAGEKMDIINNYNLDFTTEVANGTFIEMNELLDEYGKEIRKALPEWLWDYETINGKIYGIPTYQMMGQTRCFVTIKDTADKYLDQNALRNAFDASKMFDKGVYDVLTKYCENAKAGGLNFKDVSILNIKGTESLVGNYGIVAGDENAEIINIFADEKSKIRFETASEWAKKGYIRIDALSATDSANYNGKVDGNLFWDENYSPFVADNLSEKYGQEILTIPYDLEPYIGYKALAGGTSISSTCKNPEEAMQVLNLIQTDKDLYNLLVFGIEGVDYTKVGENKIETPYQSSASANDTYGLKKWIVGNTYLAYDTQADPEGYTAWAFDEVNASTYRSPLMGFQPDTTAIADMISQTNAIRDQYLQPLNTGSVPDWESNYNEFVQKLNIAGEQEIVNELQRQVDEFLRSK